MNKTLFIHIGSHKTGSSSIQSFLASSSKYLKENSFIYPISGRSGIAHHELAQSLNLHKNYSYGYKKLANKILLESDSFENIILSSEGFLNITKFHRVQDFLGYFKDYDIKIILYVREYLDYLNSAYRQFIHFRSTYTTLERHSLRLKSPEKKIDSWKKFGDLSLRFFHQDTLDGNDVLIDFLNLLGLEVNRIFQKKNISIGGNLLVFKLVANLLKKRVGSYIQISQLASQKLRFRTPINLQRNDIRYKASMESYNSYLESIFNNVLYKDFTKYPGLPDNDTLDEDYDIFCHELGLNYDKGFYNAARRFKLF